MSPNDASVNQTLQGLVFYYAFCVFILEREKRKCTAISKNTTNSITIDDNSFSDHPKWRFFCVVIAFAVSSGERICGKSDEILSDTAHLNMFFELSTKSWDCTLTCKWLNMSYNVLNQP